MVSNSSARTWGLLVCLIALVVSLSFIFSRLWGGRPEILPEPKKLVFKEDMTVAEFGRANDLPNPALKEIFGLTSKENLQRRLSDYGTTVQIDSRVREKLALAAEYATKNPVKILVKFGLWFAFLTTLFLVLGRRQVSLSLRKGMLFTALSIFGVVMGSDPNPMGTVKDAIHLYASARAIFPPRIIALTVFLVIVFLANKYICAWGCQLGALQDLIFHLNRTEKFRAIIGRQVKIPFVLTNTCRTAFLVIFIILAFLWGMDIIEPIDPFKIFKPASLGLAGVIFIGLVVVSGLFIYRPWCHFCCPFGLAGWLIEKISRVRISVDYNTCIACQKCAAACPSTVMGAILRRDKKTIPDCFACYTCRDVCPTQAIAFLTRKRNLPPPGHFEKKDRSQGRKEI